MARFSQLGFDFLHRLAIGCVLVSMVGCGRNSAEGVPRSSPFKAAFGPTGPAETISSNNLDLGFIHEDHFACLTIDVPNVISNAELADVPWDSLEEQLSKLIGPDNAILENISRAWILVDRESLSFEFGAEQTSPLVFVLDFKKIPNEKQLLETSIESDGEKKPTPDFVVANIGENRIAIGSESLTTKLSDSSGESSLAGQLGQMKLGSDVDGMIDIRPIRSLLQKVFDLAGTFGGDSVAKFSRLPEVTQRIEISFSLESKQMLEAVIYIDDDELPKEVAKMARESSGSNGSSLGGTGMMPFGIGFNGQETQAMIPATSSKWAKEVGAEITKEGLFSADAKDRRVTLKLKRPSKIKELLTASLDDMKKQLGLAVRIEKLNTIANAMQAYQEKYDCFPPSGIVNGDGDVPNQFNWRVGLLPFLDEQALYDQFDFEQPWDSPENIEIAKQIPKAFVESDAEGDQTTTRFHVVGGKLGLFNDDRAPTLKDISDKKIWTALVIEVAKDAALEWTKPGALEVDDVRLEQFGNEGENGVLFLNAAFDTRIISKDQERVRAVLTPDGDEQLLRKDFLPIIPGR